MIDETIEYIVAESEESAFEIWESGEDIWDSEEDAWEDWIIGLGNKREDGICFKLTSSKKVEALSSPRKKGNKKVMTRQEKCEKMIKALTDANEKFNAASSKIILRDDEEKPFALFLYVETNPEDVQQMLDAVEKVEADWEADNVDSKTTN